VIKSLDEWRQELREIDAELILLLGRRMELALQLLARLRSGSLTLGGLQDDLDRLGIFLYAEIDEPILLTLDKRALLAIFRRIIIEEKRVAVGFTENNSDAS